MTDFTTPEGRRELKALAEKATPGPWHHCQPYMVVPSQRTIHGPVPAERVDYVSTWPDRGTPPGHRVVIPMPREAGPGVRSDDMAFIAAANPATVLSILAALEEAEGREKARVDKVEKIGCRAAELTFDWLCGEFEDLPNKLAEDMSVQITDNIIWALGEGSAIDDFADAEQQVLELRARAEASEQREAGLIEQVASLKKAAHCALDYIEEYEADAGEPMWVGDELRAALTKSETPSDV